MQNGRFSPLAFLPYGDCNQIMCKNFKENFQSYYSVLFIRYVLRPVQSQNQFFFPPI